MNARIAWFAIGVAVGGACEVLLSSEQYHVEVERANRYERSLAMCRFVVQECAIGGDISGLTDEARAAAGLPRVEVRR